jgi:hypothetical protein
VRSSGPLLRLPTTSRSTAVRIGHADGDLLDACCHGCVIARSVKTARLLVRPDRFVAWRSLGAAADAVAELRAALAQILHRSISDVENAPARDRHGVVDAAATA